MTDRPRRLSVSAAASCLLGLAGIVMLTPLGSFAHHGVEESFLSCLVLPVGAVICGFVGIRRTGKAARRRGRVLALLGLVLGAGVLALLFTVAGLRYRTVHHYEVCGRNIRMIEEAVAAAGRDKEYRAEPEKRMERVLKQLPEGRLPVCPGGGTYTVELRFGYGTSCSKHGDRTTCSMGI